MRGQYSIYFMELSTNREYLEHLIAEGEHIHQDFKFEISSARKIAKSLSAFANTDGGRLLIGVKDNGKIAGVSSDEELYMIEAAADVYCSPKVNFEVEQIQVDGMTVLNVWIPEVKEKPIYARDEQGKSWAYVRIADENILANVVQLDVWKNANKALGELLTYTSEERSLLQELGEHGPLSINQLARNTNLDRRRVIQLLTKFILFDVVESLFIHRGFSYQLK